MPETFPATLPSGRPVIWTPADQVEEWAGIVDRHPNGAKSARARRSRGKRRFGCTIEALLEQDADYLAGFLSDHKEAGEASFYINWTGYRVPSPWIAPTLGQVAGGALGARTYFVKYTWADATTLETRASQEASLAVDANKYLTVAVRSFPAGADHVNLYIGTTTGVLYYSGRMSTSDETWTEDSASTTVDDTSADGQKILYVASIADAQVGNVVRIGAGTARQEDGIIDTIDADHFHMKANLSYEHTLAQADVVETKIGLSTQAAPPTSNTLTEAVLVRFLPDVSFPNVGGDVRRLRLDVEED